MIIPPVFAVISDIHSNYEALAVVMEDIQSLGKAQVVCLGDIVGYASGVRACLSAIRELGCPVVQGNHDLASCFPEPPYDFNDSAREGVAFSYKRLKPEERSWLKNLPPMLEMFGFSFVHATLDPDYRWDYVVTAEDALRSFQGQQTRIAFCGHTHFPGVWCLDNKGRRLQANKGEGTNILPKTGKVLINVGSVGQPRDGNKDACYVVFRPLEGTVEFRRLPYDIARTKKKIIRAKLPRYTAQRLSLGR